MWYSQATDSGLNDKQAKNGSKYTPATVPLRVHPAGAYLDVSRQ